MLLEMQVDDLADRLCGEEQQRSERSLARVGQVSTHVGTDELPDIATNFDGTER